MTIFRVDPHQTDAGIESVHGPHLAVYDPRQPSQHRLVIYIPGTGAKAEGGLQLASAFAGWGFHVLSLDYENNVVAASCSHGTDPLCFDHYRNAIVTGAPGSEKIQVSPENSILQRIAKLLLYLSRSDPGGGWNEYLNGGTPAWTRIVLAGHSQGAGHAAYIAKTFLVDRVLMFSGPQDYLDDLRRPAPWQSNPSATPPDQFFAFLNLRDPFNEQHQVANCSVLMKLSAPDPMMIAPGETIQGFHQILVNDLDHKPNHGSTVQPVFTNVWQYMVTATH